MGVFSIFIFSYFLLITASTIDAGNAPLDTSMDIFPDRSLFTCYLVAHQARFPEMEPMETGGTAIAESGNIHFAECVSTFSVSLDCIDCAFLFLCVVSLFFFSLSLQINLFSPPFPPPALILALM